jgi:hypothetical protein
LRIKDEDGQELALDPAEDADSSSVARQGIKDEDGQELALDPAEDADSSSASETANNLGMQTAPTPNEEAP